ncbi:protein FAR1-RELATED SEQUENCE 5-like [Silene latifolia]|uniref:protein FAR1-RELATED SEQUENCE 5-like n=1 Tax=Silene latifolia TaxID=37657 RepID=UPI003D788AA8
MIEFRYNGDGYVVFQFREWHNHRLCSLRNQQFQKKHRHLHLYHKKTIIDHSRVNQGPTRAFRNVKEYVDGYENVGAQLVDFKNFGRDIKCFIGDRDAQLFVNYFEDKRDTSEGFYFAYEVDSGKCLVRAFWCDAESRRNYALFGDYITYDPTYNTNKYCMLFTPFIGVDHHKRSIYFCFALLFHEDEDSFTWVFQKFLDAMGQREPHRIISDRCLWNKAGFASLFSNMLSADIACEPLEFEAKWCRLVNEHNRKRHTQKQLDRDDDCTLPQLATSLKLEAHASKVYTNLCFCRFSSRSFASICSLSVGGFTPPANGVELIGIADARTQKTYQVVYNSLTNDAECSCKLFNRKVHTLPDKYLLMQWTKNAHKIPLYGPHGELIEDFDATDLRKMEMCKLWSEFYATISVLKNVSTKDITDLVDTLKQFRVKLNPQSESMTKEQELEMLLGCNSSTEGSSDEDDADDG